MKIILFYYLFLFLNHCVSAQEYKNEISVTISIMKRLQVKIRSTYNQNSMLPNIKTDIAKRGYSAEYNSDTDNPLITLSTDTYTLFKNPMKYYSNYNINNFSKETILIDSLRHISTLIHELSHFLEDTSNYNFKSLNPNFKCNIGEVFCFVRYPSEFNAYAVGATYFLQNFDKNRLNDILKKKKSLLEKKVDIINAVYCDIFNHSDFKRPLTLADLLGISTT